MALSGNENLKSVLISVTDSTQPSVGINNFTIKLENSFVTEISQIKSPMLAASSPGPVSFIEYEEIGLSYQTITWKYGDLSHSAGWRTGNQ